MKNSEKTSRTVNGVVVLHRHGLAWTLPGFLLLLAPITFGVSLLPALFRAAQLWRSKQWVDGARVVMERGIIFRRRREVMLASVEFVQVKPSLLGAAVDCGTVLVHGEGGAILVLRHLAHPRSAQRAIQRALNTAPRHLGAKAAVRGERAAPISA